MKYKIGQVLKLKNQNKFVKIIDFEFFDDIILYYTLDKNAYPEENLEKNELFNCLSFFLYESDEEKDRIFLETMKKNCFDNSFSN